MMWTLGTEENPRAQPREAQVQLAEGHTIEILIQTGDDFTRRLQGEDAAIVVAGLAGGDGKGVF